MVYTKTKYPVKFAVLPPDVRMNAINIANVLLAEGYNKAIAENIALANARYSVLSANSKTFAHVANCIIHLVPHPMGWAIITTNALKTFAVFKNKEKALLKAASLISSVETKLILHNDRGVVEDVRNLYREDVPVRNLSYPKAG